MVMFNKPHLAHPDGPPCAKCRRDMEVLTELSALLEKTLESYAECEGQLSTTSVLLSLFAVADDIISRACNLHDPKVQAARAMLGTFGDHLIEERVQRNHG